MKRIVWLALVVALAACSAPAPALAPQPTYTPYPTFTPLPPAPSAPVANCIGWTEAAAHMGETTCVRGTVFSTFKDPGSSAFFIDFDNTRASFYGVSFSYTWDNLRGKCVELSGKISPYRGRPQMVIESREQVRECR